MDLKICYLCGKELSGIKNTDRDHIPAKQFYTKKFKKDNQNINLITLPVHIACNQSYQMDEEYFTISIGSIIPKSRTGQELYKELGQKISKRKENKILAYKVLREFGKIKLIDGKTIKYFDGKRIYRIIWKIIRGLYFKHTHLFLPENTHKRHDLITPIHKPSDDFIKSLILDVEKESWKVKYTGYFDYKFKYVDIERERVWFWNLYFWEYIVFFTSFTIEL